ncbi:MAG: sensor signal transduction histidine kinase [Edaphobacter sp.]|nr:sensor signal transduction histidine kinase [Edaphobacter sp.]
MQAPDQQKRNILGFACAVIFAPIAVWATSSLPVFRDIPWTLSYLVVAVVAEIGGPGPALVAILIASGGIYRLVLAPGHDRIFDPAHWIQTAAFLVTAFFISFVVLQRKRALSSLQASERHYRSVTETAPDVIITIDENSLILAINPAVQATFGYSPEELIGQKMVALMPERFRDSHAAGIARHLATGTRNISWNGVQLPALRKDGVEIPVEISFAAQSFNGATRFTGFIRDVSERHRAHAALIQSEKLAAVGRLASSIAHEINNPLESVTNLLYLSRGSADLATVQGYLESAEQELRRVSVIANQTLNFHKHSTSPTEVECDKLMTGSLALYHGRLVNVGISVEERYRALRAAFCVEGEVRQVLNNFVGNSIDATPQGGRILARSRDATHWSSGRRGVALTVADTGTGLSPEVRAQMFQPFFSTKGSGGAGLGLWISDQLIARNGGSLRIRSSQASGSSGTVLVLFLPDNADSNSAVIEQVGVSELPQA